MDNTRTKPTYAELEHRIRTLEEQLRFLQTGVDDIFSATSLHEYEQEGLNTIFDAIRDVIVLFDNDGTYLKITPQVPQYLYKPVDEMMGRTVFEVLPISTATVFYEAIQLCLETRSTQNFEYYLEIGRFKIWYDARMSPVSDKHIVLVARNITERKNMEYKLEKSKANLKAMFDSSPQIYCLLNAEYRILTFNQRAERYYRKTYGKEISVYSNFLDLIPESEQNAFIEDFARSIRGEKIQKEIRLCPPDGDNYWLDISFLPVSNFRSEVFAVAYIILDITHRKQELEMLKESEEKYRAIFDNAALGIFRTTLSGRFIEVNPAMLDMLGYAANDQILRNTHFQDFLSQQTEQEQLLQLLDSIGVAKFEAPMKRSDGTLFVADITLKTIKDLDSHPIHIEGIISDVTDKQRMIEAIQRSEEELREINASKDKFFSILAHDLKNPFNSLISITDMLLNNLNEEEKVRHGELVGLLSESAQHGYNLLDNLLKWSRSQTGKLIWTPEPLLLNEFVEDNIKIFDNQAINNGILINTDIPDDIKVNADPYMLSTILRNLISNALKYTPKGGKVFISAQIKGRQSVVTIKDTGIGINDDTKKHLFKIDSHVSSPGLRGEGGTGLGLILCKEFVKQHKGEIWVESQSGKGAAFSFSLPIA